MKNKEGQPVLHAALGELWTITVPKEERALEAEVGETFRHYKNRGPRWLGKLER